MVVDSFFFFFFLAETRSGPSSRVQNILHFITAISDWTHNNDCVQTFLVAVGSNTAVLYLPPQQHQY